MDTVSLHKGTLFFDNNDAMILWKNVQKKYSSQTCRCLQHTESISDTFSQNSFL